MTARTFILFNAVFVIAAVLAWPIYQHPAFTVLVTVSLLVANAVVLLANRLGWRTRTLWFVGVALFLVLGVPLAVPSSLTSPAAVFGGLLTLVTGLITSWRDLLTLSLPVGSYQAVLVPAYVLFFIAPLLAFTIATRAVRARPAASIPVALPLLFAITFGSSAPRSIPFAGGTWFAAPVEIILVLTAFLVLLRWMRSLRAPRRSAARRQRRLTPVLTVAATIVAALLIALPVMANSSRDVLRTQIEPSVRVDAELSPLSLYRASFSDELYDTELFQVSGGTPERIRLATLTGYNGQVATVQSDTSPNDLFARVPALVSAPEGAADVTVVISALRGIWMPTVSNLQAISFGGDRRLALTDGFFYNSDLAAGIQLSQGGLGSGDSVRLRATPTVETDADSLATLTPGLSQPRINPAFVPESLQDWIVLQRVPRSGSGLATLIERLTARGYLSHSITVDPTSPPEWMLDLPGYQFEPSRAGHSTARIDQLFTALRDRQRELGPVSDAELVAAVGDDEQFAVAALLLADQLGFNARVVVGTKLQAPEDSVIPACVGGSCAGGNLSAWLEVQGADGRWVAVDVTPQVANPIAPEVERLQDPQVPTQVEPKTVDSVQPPEAAPSQRETQPDGGDNAEAGLAWLLAAVRWLGIVALIVAVLFGPFLIVLFGKAARSRRRREPNQPELGTLGAWYEFVDAQVDLGVRPPRNETRQEFVARLEPALTPPDAGELAALADQAVFDTAPLSREARDRAWAILDAQRSIHASQSRRTRLRAALSLRSLLSRARGEG